MLNASTHPVLHAQCKIAQRHGFASSEIGNIITARAMDAVRDHANYLEQLHRKARNLRDDMNRLMASIEQGGLDTPCINSLGEAQGADEVNRLCAVVREKREQVNDMLWLAVQKGEIKDADAVENLLAEIVAAGEAAS